MSDPIETFSDEDFRAADYVLGTSGPAERIAAARRLRDDPAFRAEVEAWEERLAPMAAAVAPVTPRPGLYAAIEAALPRPRRAAPERQVAAGEGLVPAFWRWLALGSGALAAASLAALALLAVPVLQGPADTAGAGFAATTITSDTDGFPIFAVVLDPASDTATLVPIRLEPGPGQVPELWIARDGGAPQSLGTFDPDVPLRISLEPGLVSGDLSRSLLAISLEPEGGSPTGQPTGPVVGHGELNSI